MTPRTALLSILMALALVAGACSGDDAEPTSTNGAAASSTSSTAAPPTTRMPSTSTSSATTTTGEPPAAVVVRLDGQAPDGFEEAVAELYTWLADPETRPRPDIPDGLREHLEGIEPAASSLLRGDWSAATFPEGEQVGVAVLGSDVILLVDAGDGWRVVGAKLERFDREPWYGEPVRRVLIVGTDARPWEDQTAFRADSIHILTSAIGEQSGAVLGFPRDSYVTTPGGNRDKFTHVNVYYGADGMVDVAEALSGVELEGYVLTGFQGFELLVNDFDGVPIDVPFAMNEPKSGAYLIAGPQILWGANALAFSRNRTIANGDFRRSLHQGLVILGALDKVQGLGILALPELVAMLSKHSWTDLDAESLLTLAAGAFEIDAETVPNVVLPGAIRTMGGASVVVLADGAFDVLADLEDGLLTEELPSGALTSD